MDTLYSDPFDLLTHAQAAPRPADSSHAAASSCAAGSSGLSCCHAVCSSCICFERCGIDFIASLIYCRLITVV